MLQWAAPGARLTRTCPLCRTRAAHPVVLTAKTNAGLPHRLLRCKACSCRFYRSLRPLHYHDESEDPYLRKFYLEQGAGIEHMVRPLFALDRPAAASLLDVGCGFGFSVIAARHVLGWRACGVEPGPMADDGRVQGDADIKRAMLSDEMDLGGLFDMVLASEVIEHVPDPDAFVAMLRRRLNDGGVVALTTPNAEVITPERPDAELMQVLSPGGHLVLFTAETLAACLRRVGFTHVLVEARGSTLAAYGSDRPLAFRPSRDAAAQEGCRGLLRHMLDRAVPASPLWNGAAQRLLAQARDDVERWALFHRIADVWRTAFGLDVTDPCGLPPLPPGSPDAVPGQPVCVGSVLLTRAGLERRESKASVLNALLFSRHAAEFASHARAKLLAMQLEDLSLRETVTAARLQLTQIVGELVPGAEGDMMVGLAWPSHGPERVAFDLDPDTVIHQGARRFTALVHDGDYLLARRFLPLFADATQTSRVLNSVPRTLMHVLFCQAILLLNGDRDPAAAAAAFRRLLAFAQSDAVATADPALGQEFTGLALQHLELAARQESASAEPAV